MRPGDSELSSAAGLGRLEARSASRSMDVALFGEVVAALVHCVDGAFDCGDVVVGGVGSAGAVFDVPEVEVGAVLGYDGFEQEGLAGCDDS